MNVKTKTIIACIFTAILVSGIWAGVITKQSYESGRLCDKLRERILDAEDTNRRLAETVEQCQSICGDIGQSVDRSIRTARDAIEIIEELRVQVYSLEVVCGDFDWDSYYQYWDSYLGLEN